VRKTQIKVRLENLLTAQQTASLLGMSLEAVRTAGKRKKIPGRIKVAGRIYFDRACLEVWLADGIDGGTTRRLIGHDWRDRLAAKEGQEK
jgi:hypothetical protein